jgi:NADH-quinone oxidoreductase subunit J
MGPTLVYFWVCAASAVVGALSTVAARNPIRGAMGLLLLILSVAGLFLPLHAQFLAAVQLIVYAGAIVVLFLFVIMLLGPSSATPPDRGTGLLRWARALSGGVFALGGGCAWVLISRGTGAGTDVTPEAPFGGIDALGSVLFSDALVPFELSSALLLVGVLGAVAVARGRQGQRTLSETELAIARGVATPTTPAEGSGVFSHEIDARAGDHAR